MRRLFRLVLPLGLLAALAIPIGASAQTTVTEQGGNLNLLASSPTGQDSISFTGDLHSNTTVDNLSVDVRSIKIGSVVTGAGIAAPSLTLAASPTGATYTIANELITFTTTAPHGLTVGTVVTVAGVGLGVYNGTYSINTVPSATTFTVGTPLHAQFGVVNPPGTNGIPSGGGTVNAVTTVANVGASSLTLSLPATATASTVALQAASARQNTDLAFWGDILVQGNTRGIRVFDISDPANPDLQSDFACNGAYGDVTIWENLVFRSVDVPQTSASCGSTDQTVTLTGGNHSATAQSTSIATGFEGIQIIDISTPSSPSFVAGVATDCGSFTHTIVPDLANNRVLLYVSSFPNAGVSDVPTTFGNTCERTTGTGHDKISVIAVDLDNPAGAGVVHEVALGLKGYNSYFSYLPGYTGDFNNTPGYKGCHDIAVSMATKTAAAACVTEGITLDITNPELPTVKDHFVNANIDLCATGVYRWSGGTNATTPNCMWATATFSYDGKYVIWGDLASGYAGCSSSSVTAAHSCNEGGNINASVDRMLDGTSVSNECDLGAGTAPVRDPFNRGAYWAFAANDPSWPVSSFKTPRFERYSGQGCTSGLMNIVPVNGAYVMPASWHAGGVDVVDWGNPLDTNTFPTELGWYDVNVDTAMNSASKSNAWASYWYNGHVYASYDGPSYGGFASAGTRGLEVFTLNDPAVAGAFDLPHLNPQTQESQLACSITIGGSPKVGKARTVTVTVKALGQNVLGAAVRAKTFNVNSTKTTGASGKVSFRFKPKKKAKTLNISVAAQPNMLGCSKTKKIAR